MSENCFLQLDTLGRKTKDNVSQLSGGERSITTVAFLLALWERIKSPIRCLDEFEVFMDQDKKSRATLMLCQYASKHPKTQVYNLFKMVNDMNNSKTIKNV